MNHTGIDNRGITVRRFTSFAEARAAARGLLDDDAQPGPFDRLDWFAALHASAFADAPPLILEARAGETAAWLFLAPRAAGHAGSLANWYSFSFRPQFVGAPDSATQGALIAALAHRLRGDHHRLTFHPVIDEGDGPAARLIQALGAGGWAVVPRIMGHKRLLHLPAGVPFAHYWAERPGTLRSTLARKAQRYPLDIQVHRLMNDALWAEFEAVFAASWKPEGDDFALLRAFADREADAGRLRLGIARDRDRPVAVELWTVDQGTAYIHKLAFDERAAEASPGTQLSHAMFARAIDTDLVTIIDFGTGDNPYKANWIPHCAPMLQIDAFDLRKAATWLPALAARVSALKPVTRNAGGKSAKPQMGERDTPADAMRARNSA